ncbi:hypothetical protein JCM17380_51390 [Desulfosporosinus burensis]
MPRGDGTGPMGRAAMNRRSSGFCYGANPNPNGVGLGPGLGAGYRRGPRRNFVTDPPTGSKTQKEVLKEQKELLENKLEIISRQLQSL